ncbi:GNAT family N-acetyltransferase [Rhizobium sp. AQ_MP]|uniref:GNAT family N-acetyltransferase n=1 Tax=Rhizobium sp. AQ_MP TaxID=2761536 RepID=UPI002484CCC9|nr:GNAT family N-acetyltransferase [Rhizobium sp. AQ_MP]
MSEILPLVSEINEDNLPLFEGMLDLFAEAFEDEESYSSRRPSKAHILKLLGSGQFIALVAVRDGGVVGALTAYEIVKYEQERSELYIFDLAVSPALRRQGIATALISRLLDIGRSRGVSSVYVQAHAEDEPAVALYSRLGVRSEVLHFDLPVS